MTGKVQFKFRADASGDDREQLIAKLEDGGAEQVEPLFPDADDGELAALYSMVLSKNGSSRKLLRLLQNSRLVDFAEPQAGRRLVLPVELRDRATRP